MAKIIKFKTKQNNDEKKRRTREVLNRQDFVDNSIFELLRVLSGKPLEWNINLISSVRESIEDVFDEQDIISTDEFYPTGDESEESSGNSCSFSNCFTLSDFFREVFRAIYENPLLFVFVIIGFVSLIWGIPIFFGF